MAYLMGIDMGTTSVKTAVFDEALQEKMKLTADYTLDSKGELLLTLMSSLAQEESRSLSQNVTWGQRNGIRSYALADYG